MLPRASGVGLAISLSRIGAAAGTYLVPISLASLGIGPTILAAAAISLFGALASWWLAPETAKLDLQQASSLDVCAGAR